MRLFKNSIFRKEQRNDYRFPNLLADKDFIDYYWTLPFTTGE